jgi:hypothetical protein
MAQEAVWAQVEIDRQTIIQEGQPQENEIGLNTRGPFLTSL